MPDQNSLSSSSSPPSQSQTTQQPSPQPIPPPLISKPPFQSQILPTTPTAYNSSTTLTTSTVSSSSNNSSDILNPAEEYARYERFKRRTAWACLVLSPTIALLPPRKLDLYTLGLTGMFVVSASHLALNSEIAKQAAANVNANADGESSGFASRWWQRQRWQKQQQQQRQRDTAVPVTAVSTGKQERIGDNTALSSPSKAVAEELRKETWKERRMREEREAFARGRGYGDLIMDQIREVVGWDKTGAEGKKKEEEGDVGKVVTASGGEGRGSRA